MPERELNDLRKLDGAPAGLRLEFTQVRRNSRHSLELLSHVDLPIQEVDLADLNAEDLTPA
ncbi:MAG: hypothetical protein JO281_15990 [Pseudonocardiales bacterium]|nr:hypothetical protein [Pseudonocardiales bacterium]